MKTEGAPEKEKKKKNLSPSRDTLQTKRRETFVTLTENEFGFKILNN